MRITFVIDVGIDVPSYVQAGEILDRVTQEVEKAVGEKGMFDVRSFQAQHTSIHKHEVPTEAYGDLQAQSPKYSGS